VNDLMGKMDQVLDKMNDQKRWPQKVCKHYTMHMYVSWWLEIDRC
jgi:hypothetical protein